MSIAIPSWAQADVSSIRANKSLGQGANRQALDAASASQMDQVFSGQMDQLKVIDETPQDGAPNQPGVVKLPMPDMGLPIKIDPPTVTYEGDKNNGSSITEMNQMGMQMCTVTDYSPQSVDTIIVLGGPMAGTQLVHVDRVNPGNSYVESKGEVWNMMGAAMNQIGKGGGLGLPGFG